MLFNSYIFIFIYLPITLVIFFVLNRNKYIIASKVWLSFASILFYVYWNVKYLPLLLGSIFFNYSIGTILSEGRIKSQDIKKKVLTFGILCNVGLLCYYKYLNFFIDNVNNIFQLYLGTWDLILPLGISFFTFTQIAFLVDTYHKKSYELNFLNYVLFVTFFPHLIAGPIIHHKEMMPQFDSLRNKVVSWKNIYRGLFLFSVGLFKKVIIADGFSAISIAGFDKATTLNFIEAWTTSLSYTIQLYFDFSGYTDMALGLSLLFNIMLPINFNSPYKALDIADFWRRWHITLSRFLREYIYFPLGGSHRKESITYRNLLIVFSICGLWHGAGWHFIFWGFLNGLALVVHRIWRRNGIIIPKIASWAITFNFVNFCWIFFRAKDWADATKVIKGMLAINGLALPTKLQHLTPHVTHYLSNLGIKFTVGWNENLSAVLTLRAIPLLFIVLVISALMPNSQDLEKKLIPTYYYSATIILLLWVALGSMNKVSEFLYFTF